MLFSAAAAAEAALRCANMDMRTEEETKVALFEVTHSLTLLHAAADGLKEPRFSQIVASGNGRRGED